MDFLISASGLVLIAAPWLFRYSSSTIGTVTSVVLGAIICAVAAYRAFSKDEHKWEEWTVVIAGVLAIAAPFVLGFTAPALSIIGLIAAALGVYQAASGPSHTTGARPA